MHADSTTSSNRPSYGCVSMPLSSSLRCRLCARRLGWTGRKNDTIADQALALSNRICSGLSLVPEAVQESRGCVP